MFSKESAAPSLPASHDKVTPLFGRERVRLHDGQPSTHSLQLRWNSRLRKLLNAEQQMHRAQRLRALTYAIIVACTLVLGFSLYLAPVAAAWVFVLEATALMIGLVILPYAVLRSKECRRHRDTLSRKFYESNHEVEYTDDALVLIDRSTYTAVTRVPLTEL
ncbi:hypothetical protein IT774_02280 [Salinimonas marina]|uniref:Uncharacterized protein n=1 Tax=Salinimonas marina TaxID=2785918 RepID=A0A7S9HDF3_9ALTE|nr:hypothetical protein [Salinimonas marina]QPG06079.1 hypothetical protein IT774_02280 [Salinimonas marina]